MKKPRVLVLSMLLSVAALAVNSQTVCAFGFCDTCLDRCTGEASEIRSACRGRGGTEDQCWREFEKYYYACQSLFCTGCDPAPRAPSDN